RAQTLPVTRFTLPLGRVARRRAGVRLERLPVLPAREVKLPEPEGGVRALGTVPVLELELPERIHQAVGGIRSEHGGERRRQSARRGPMTSRRAGQLGSARQGERRARRTGRRRLRVRVRRRRRGEQRDQEQRKRHSRQDTSPWHSAKKETGGRLST